MSPQGDEREAREQIDRLLTAAGWLVCDAEKANLSAHRGVAIREFPVPGYGFAVYLLYVDGKAAGVIEAKKQGATLTDVETQSAKYTTGLPKTLPAWHNPLPFAYESTGVETHFTNALDPKPRARGVFAFHRPKNIGRVAGRGTATVSRPTCPCGHPSWKLRDRRRREEQVANVVGRSAAPNPARASVPRADASLVEGI